LNVHLLSPVSYNLLARTYPQGQRYNNHNQEGTKYDKNITKTGAVIAHSVQ